jgi:hypothetical protein
MAFYRVLACEVLLREICFEAAQSPHTIDVSFNGFGLHHAGCEKMVSEIQAQVDSVEKGKYDAILLGYALCNNGIAGLTARDIPIVVARGHDCITLLLGSKERYGTEFSKEPGTYYYSPGWVEHRKAGEGDDVYQRLGLTKSYQELVEKYGEENAKYLLETMGSLGTHHQTYTRIAYIDTGVGPREDLILKIRPEAEKNGWRIDQLKGDRSLIRKLLSGDWNETEFLVVKPGQTIRPTYDNSIVAAE